MAPGTISARPMGAPTSTELRQQVTDDLSPIFDVEPPLGFGRRREFEALDAEVQAGGMIVAGIHYGHDEVDAARRLLRELGQSKRSLRSVLEFVRRERLRSDAPKTARMPASNGRSVPTHRRIESKRRTLDRLPRRWAELRRAIDSSYSWPQAQARVNRAMGVKRRADACEADLDAGLAFLLSELAKLADMYPAEAERLRIPASVRAIDDRLRAAGSVTA